MKRTAVFVAALSLCFVPLHLSACPPYRTDHPAINQSVPSVPHNTQDKGIRTYVIRVIDTQSKAPVNKAKISVQLDDSAKTKWGGYTDSKGLFQFKWLTTTQSVKAHISIEAQGFMTLDDYNVLMEDRVIPLTRAD